MKQHLNHKCKIEIEVKTSLFYDATITSIDKNTITFIDKFNNIYTYGTDRIKEINVSEG
jgi:hypothetical protein